MGTYNNSKYDIVEKLNEALDEIEGDFDKETLHNALEKLKEYPYTKDNINCVGEAEWHKYISEGD